MLCSKLCTRPPPSIGGTVKTDTTEARFNKDIAHKYCEHVIVVRVSYCLTNNTVYVTTYIFTTKATLVHLAINDNAIYVIVSDIITHTPCSMST